jgi:hypothetical protein
MYCLVLYMLLASPLSLGRCYAGDIEWVVKGLGKPSGELMVGPNGLFYISSGSKTILVDANGKKLREINVSGGSKGGSPVFGPHGTLYYPGSGSVQEVLANGKSGWNFKIQEDNAKAIPLLSTGPLNLLYIPLPSALYAVDLSGRYQWRLLWSNTEANRLQVDTKREILCCKGNGEYLFIIYGEQNSGFTLAAVDSKGEFAWRYWLGNIKGASLVTSPDGKLYVTAYPRSIDRTNKGKVYMFEDGGSGSPSWIYSVIMGDLTAPAVTTDGQLYFCAPEFLFKLDTADGSEMWRQTYLKAQTQPAVDEYNKRIYIGTEDERLLAVDFQGRLLWEIKLEGTVAGRPLRAAGGEFYVLTDKGYLYKIKK